MGYAWHGPIMLRTMLTLVTVHDFYPERGRIIVICGNRRVELDDSGRHCACSVVERQPGTSLSATSPL